MLVIQKHFRDKMAGRLKTYSELDRDLGGYREKLITYEHLMRNFA